jgi:aldose 1-epimerase
MDPVALSPTEHSNHIINGIPVHLYIIRAPEGPNYCAITNYGGRLVSLHVPDCTGNLTDIVLGYPSLDDYLQEPEEFMGAIVGRCANRIAAGLFVLDGHTYALPTNNNHNTLHGGIQGLHARAWEVRKATDSMLALFYRAADGEEGFPGNLDIEVTYEWTEANKLVISYHATTDKATLVNLTNHSYFNLNGGGAGTILDHELQIAADAITPVDETLIPTGKLAPVAGTPFDFTSPRLIGAGIDDDDEQLRLGHGYDHNFVLRGTQPALSVRAASTGIRMSVTTDRPGMQVYTGNFLDGSRAGKSGRANSYRSALVLEPQGFPDAIHHPQFPSVVLRPGDTYRSVSAYEFEAS